MIYERHLLEKKSETKSKSNIKSKIKKNKKKHFANHLEQRITRRNNAVEEKPNTKNLFIQNKMKRIYIIYNETDRETDGQLSMLNNIVPRNKVNSSQIYRKFTI